MNYWNLLLSLFFLFTSSTLSAQERDWMSLQKMEDIFRKEVQEIDGEPGYWTLLYADLPLIVITDTTANRMRIFSPVVEENKLEPGQLKQMLEANFHSALDAKYCLYNDYVISVFTHPLKELTKRQLIDAMQQVVTLVYTFGTSYSSTEMVFGGGFQEKEQPKVNQSPTKKGKKN